MTPRLDTASHPFPVPTAYAHARGEPEPPGRGCPPLTPVRGRSRPSTSSLHCDSVDARGRGRVLGASSGGDGGVSSARWGVPLAAAAVYRRCCGVLASGRGRWRGRTSRSGMQLGGEQGAAPPACGCCYGDPWTEARAPTCPGVPSSVRPGPTLTGAASRIGRHDARAHRLANEPPDRRETVSPAFRYVWTRDATRANRPTSMRTALASTTPTGNKAAASASSATRPHTTPHTTRPTWPAA
jgi:hypothetical protein